MRDYKEEYEYFWKEIVEVNGVLNLDQVKRELFDFSFMINEVPKVYDHISGGHISKPLTHAHHLIDKFDEAINAVKDRCCDGCKYFNYDSANDSAKECEIGVWDDFFTINTNKISCGEWEKR